MKYPNERLVTFTIKINGIKTRVVLRFLANIKRVVKLLMKKNKNFKYTVITRRDLWDYGRTSAERSRARLWYNSIKKDQKTLDN